MAALSAKLDNLDAAIDQLNSRLAAEEEGMAAVVSLLTRISSVQLPPAPSAQQTSPNQQQRPRKSALKTVQAVSVLPSPQQLEIVRLSASEFDGIPKYLKGRLSLEKLNQWTELLEKVFVEKYTIMQANPAKLGGENRNRYYEWRDQDSEECRGQPFVTEQDMKNLCQGKGPKMDPTGRSIVAILRHCGRLREVRSTGIVRLVLN